MRNVWRATSEQLRIIVPSGTVDVNLATGEVLREVQGSDRRIPPAAP